ncbi:MAG TPA: cytochrome P450 [Nocardioides sp.]|nr:cytochrome P450 [Nocardioides sp.]
MTTTPAAAELNWDPFTRELWEDPYPTYKRLRDEAPVYYNEQHDFWALSRWEDCDFGLADQEHFSSARGNILEFIQAGIEMPPGTVIMEDPPSHDINRALISRLFTPKAILGLEPAIRDYTTRNLDPVAGVEEWDVIRVLSDTVPMRVIGMLMGIPEEMQQEFRESTVASLQTGEDGRMGAVDVMDTSLFEKYIDWRLEHPADDIMTKLLTAEFVDAEGVTRTLTRDEVIVYCTVVSGAGNDTTGNLISWFCKLLAEERYRGVYQQLVDDPSLIPACVEEVLRVEPVGHAVARYVKKDVTFQGQVIPAGSACTFIVASANRDERVWGDNADVIELGRRTNSMRTFGKGPHYCIGANLARMEGRIVLEELVKRYPKGWDIDLSQARLASTSTVRGWEKLPLRPRS